MLMKDNEEKRKRGGENQFTIEDEKTDARYYEYGAEYVTET